LRDITRFKELEISFSPERAAFGYCVGKHERHCWIYRFRWNSSTYQPSHKDVLGYEEGEFNGKSVFNFVHPEDIDEVKLAFKEMIEDRFPEKSAVPL